VEDVGVDPIPEEVQHPAMQLRPIAHVLSFDAIATNHQRERTRFMLPSSSMGQPRISQNFFAGPLEDDFSHFQIVGGGSYGAAKTTRERRALWRSS
jgi:hypothetical protein